ncbi:MAG TPA: hypothetical protein VNJ01_18175 [Bacteriovoracaceae bacterium]|nr:hypothetical protein [Bacteriovoracaceae bacterium]
MFLLFSFLLAFQAFGSEEKLHLDLELSSQEYAKLLIQKKFSGAEVDPAITEALRNGERLSKWISLLNASRSADAAIRLTSASTRRGYPIESPFTYSPATIKTETISILSNLPDEMLRALKSPSELPGSLTIDDATFITHARYLDTNYQRAARYTLLDPNRAYYIGAAKKDIRGYHFLTTRKIGPEQLRDPVIVRGPLAEKISEALLKICLNSGASASTCTTKLKEATDQNSLDDFYQAYFLTAQTNWDNFFKIPFYRGDVRWSGNVLTVPFNTPSEARFVPYLRDNIQDEFRFSGWKLLLDFGSFDFGPRLVFKPGVVPHVNALAGNQIIMDANQPIEEYESKWTIRHEFGHVLGLPDCYHEFYDVKTQAYVSYQLDTSDLMCSRAGNMNERIYQELRRVYRKNFSTDL